MSTKKIKFYQPRNYHRCVLVFNLKKKRRSSRTLIALTTFFQHSAFGQQASLTVECIVHSVAEIYCGILERPILCCTMEKNSAIALGSFIALHFVFFNANCIPINFVHQSWSVCGSIQRLLLFVILLIMKIMIISWRTIAKSFEWWDRFAYIWPIATEYDRKYGILIHYAICVSFHNWLIP